MSTRRGSSQTNTAGVSSKDRSSAGPRPDVSAEGGGASALPSEATRGFVPVGGIVMYSGALASIPANWKLCDGTSGTPNMTDRFILATATEIDIGTTGGAKKHRHNLVASDTPAGTATVVAITAGTPAGTMTSVSGGTPAGTVDAHTTTAVTPTGAVNAQTGPGTHTFTGAPLAGHTHVFTGTALGTHTHLLAGKTALGESEAGLYADNDVLPPWFKLAFIQRMT